MRTYAVAGMILAALATAAVAAPQTAAYDSGGTGMAARLLVQANRAAYHGRYSEAITLDTRALAVAPSYGEAFLRRARHSMDIGLYAQASGDLDHVIAMHPDDMGLAMTRVDIALRQRDPRAALANLKQALTLPLRSYWHQPEEAGTYEAGSGSQFEVTGHMESVADEYTSIAEQLLHHDDASLAAMQRMITIEAQHPEYILASYCYRAGLAGLLESAELACDESISQNAHDIGQYDSQGYVHLRMHQWDKAIADYDHALQGRADLTISLYGRGLAKRAKGDRRGATADLAAAASGEPDIVNIMRRLGVPPA